MIYLKTAEELELMRAACDLTARTLGEVAKWIKPGITTRRVDDVAREFILDNGGVPTCLGYHGFPGTLCIEVNENVVHGFPSDYILRDGDIVGTDLVVDLNGFNGDSCYTFAVGEIDPKTMRLLQTTLTSLYKGINAAKAGNRIGDISNMVQTYCEKAGYSVVREMCGHGIGRSMHESPEIPNYGRRGTGAIIKNGMCLCIEPMITAGSYNVKTLRDGWTVVTTDGSLCSHYEHTILITDGEPELLSLPGYHKEEKR